MLMTSEVQKLQIEEKNVEITPFSKMGRLFLFLFLVSLTVCNGALEKEQPSASNDDHIQQTHQGGHLNGNLRNDELPSDVKHSSDAQVPNQVDSLSKRTSKQSWASFLPFVSPIDSQTKVHQGLFSHVAENVKTNLDLVKQRQDVLLKFAETACPNTNNCQRVPEIDDDSFDEYRLFNWIFDKSSPFAGVDKLFAVMNAFKNSVEKLTLRQNVLYEHVSCSCNEENECHSNVKPILEVMFSNNAHISGELVNSLMSGSKSSTASLFLHHIANLINKLPSISGWIGSHLNYFNPLSSILGSNLIGGAINNFIKPGEAGGFWTNIFGGNKPSSSSSGMTNQGHPVSPGIGVGGGGYAGLGSGGGGFGSAGGSAGIGGGSFGGSPGFGSFGSSGGIPGIGAGGNFGGGIGFGGTPGFGGVGGTGINVGVGGGAGGGIFNRPGGLGGSYGVGGFGGTGPGIGGGTGGGFGGVGTAGGLGGIPGFGGFGGVGGGSFGVPSGIGGSSGFGGFGGLGGGIGSLGGGSQGTGNIGVSGGGGFGVGSGAGGSWSLGGSSNSRPGSSYAGGIVFNKPVGSNGQVSSAEEYSSSSPESVNGEYVNHGGSTYISTGGDSSKPTSGHQIINNPGGGTTHVSYSTDGSGVSVSSSSESKGDLSKSQEVFVS